MQFLHTLKKIYSKHFLSRYAKYQWTRLCKGPHLGFSSISARFAFMKHCHQHGKEVEDYSTFLEYFEQIYLLNLAQGSPFKLDRSREYTIDELMPIEAALCQLSISKCSNRLTDYGKASVLGTMQRLISNQKEFLLPVCAKRQSLHLPLISLSFAVLTALGIILGPLSVGAGLTAVAIGLATAGLWTLADRSKVLQHYMQSQISSTWEEVFQQRTFADAYIVSGMLSMTYAENNGAATSDITQFTPSEAYLFYAICLPSSIAKQLLDYSDTEKKPATERSIPVPFIKPCNPTPFIVPPGSTTHTLEQMIEQMNSVLHSHKATPID